MKFKLIFLANLAEIATSLIKLMHPFKKQEEIFEDHAYCDRFVCANTDNRVLITPFLLDKEFFNDINQLLGFKNTINLYPKKIEESLCRAILKDNKLLKTIMVLIEKNPGIKIISYAATKEFRELVNFLRKKGLSFQTPEMPIESNLWTASFFDSKAGFRQTAYSLGKAIPSMPEGFICHSQEEIIGWAKYFAKKDSGFVLKTNRGLAGSGMAIIKKEDFEGKNVNNLVKNILKKELYWKKELVVVEKFIEPDWEVCGGAPNVEMKIDGQTIECSYTCGMRISPKGVFQGLELGLRAVPQLIRRTLFKTGKRFGQFLAECGYQGFFEIDWVYSKSGKVYPLEANLRRTGGTHVFELAQRLLGKDFSDGYYLAAQMKTETPRFKNQNYAFVKDKLTPFLYPIKGRKEGVVLMIINYLKKGKLGYIVIGENKEKANEIEKDFLKNLT